MFAGTRMNWHRVKPDWMRSDDGEWWINRTDQFGDKVYVLWHEGEPVAEHLDYNALMERAEKMVSQ